MEIEHEDKGVPQIYEIGYHFVPTLSEDDVALRVGEIQKLVARHDGTVIAEEFPAFTDLSYTIRKSIAGKWEKYSQAYFGWIKFEVAPIDAQAMNEELRTMDFVLRFLLVKSVRESTMTTRPITVKKEVLESPDATKGPLVEAEVDKAIDELVTGLPLVENAKSE